MLLAIFVGRGVRVANLAPERLVSWNVVIDDGFYYLQIARNMARGWGSTFDRVDQTNGYQPLWALALVPIYWITDDAGAGMRAMLVLATLLAALGLALLAFAIRRMAGSLAAVLVCALLSANPYLEEIVLQGLETPLLLLCFAALIWLWATRNERLLAGAPRVCFSVGLLMGLTVITRLDTLLILLVLGLCLLLWGREAVRLRLTRGAWTATGAALPISSWVLWSYLSQGSMVPVSGMVKRWVLSTYVPTWELFMAAEQWRGLTRTLQLVTFPFGPAAEFRLDQVLPLLCLPVAGLVVLALRLLWRRSARRNAAAGAITIGLALGCAVHALYMFFVYRACEYWNYHYFFPLGVLFVCLCALPIALVLGDLGGALARLARSPVLMRRGSWIALIVALLVATPIAAQGLEQHQRRYRSLSRDPQRSFRKSRWDAALALRQRIPPDAVIGAWWAGTLGYWSDRRVVNLDGLVNSTDFFRHYLRPRRVGQFIVEGARLSYLVDFFWRNPLDPSFRPGPAHQWFASEKERVVKGLRRRLSVTQFFRFSGAAGTYLLRVSPPKE